MKPFVRFVQVSSLLQDLLNFSGLYQDLFKYFRHYAPGNFFISLGNIAFVKPENIFIHGLSGILVPEPAGIAGNFVCKDNFSISPSKFQLEIRKHDTSFVQIRHKQSR